MAQQTLETYTKAIALTPSDTVNSPQVDNRYPDALYVGTAGKVVLAFADGTTVLFDAPQGVLPIKGSIRVNNTTTDASEIVGLWQL